MLSLSIVNRTVQLDDQAMDRTAKVHDEWTQWMLAAELETMQVLSPESGPKHGFCRGHLVA